MSSILADKLAAVNFKPLKASLEQGEGVLQVTEGQARLIAKALERADLTVKAAAAEMGISESLLARQLRSVEHLSWQRLSLLPDRFFVELLPLIAETRGIAVVKTQIEFQEVG